MINFPCQNELTRYKFFFNVTIQKSILIRKTDAPFRLPHGYTTVIPQFYIPNNLPHRIMSPLPAFSGILAKDNERAIKVMKGP